VSNATFLLEMSFRMSINTLNPRFLSQMPPSDFLMCGTHCLAGRTVGSWKARTIELQPKPGAGAGWVEQLYLAGATTFNFCFTITFIEPHGALHGELNKVAVNSLGEPLFRLVFAASSLPHARDWATAVPRGRRRALANALIVARPREFGGAAGGLASYDAAAGAQSWLPVNRISDLQKFRAAILPTWRRACAQSASSMGAKLREMLDEHMGVLEPLSLGSG